MAAAAAAAAAAVAVAAAAVVAVVAAVAFVVAMQLLSIPDPQLQAMYPDPKGYVHGCTQFSDRGRMPSRKIRAGLCVPAGAPSGKGLSLVTFFGPTKKVTRPKAEAVAVVLAVVVRYVTSKIKCFRLKAGHFSLLSPKKSNQKKWLSPTELTPRT